VRHGDARERQWYVTNVTVTPEQLRSWHALLSAEAADPNVGRATTKRAWSW
jgi:hypothetical protein